MVRKLNPTALLENRLGAKVRFFFFFWFHTDENKNADLVYTPSTRHSKVLAITSSRITHVQNKTPAWVLINTKLLHLLCADLLFFFFFRGDVWWTKHRKCVKLAAEGLCLKSLQRPVSRAAHFNVSVLRLGEGWLWPPSKAHAVTDFPQNPPTQHHSHQPYVHLRLLTRHFMLILLFLASVSCFSSTALLLDFIYPLNNSRCFPLILRTHWRAYLLGSICFYILLNYRKKSWGINRHPSSLSQLRV